MCTNYKTVYFCTIIAEKLERKLDSYNKELMTTNTFFSIKKDYVSRDFAVKGYTIIIENKIGENLSISNNMSLNIKKLSIQYQIPIILQISSKKQTKLYFMPQICL